LVNWALLWTVWRRSVAIGAKVAEPELVHGELLRLLANACAAGRAMLDAFPASELSGVRADRRRALMIAIAAVDEFAPNQSALPDD